MMKVVFLDTVHGILDERLTQKGFDCVHLENSSLLEIEKSLETAEGIVIRSRFPMNASFLSKESKPQVHCKIQELEWKTLTFPIVLKKASFCSMLLKAIGTQLVSTPSACYFLS